MWLNHVRKQNMIIRKSTKQTKQQAKCIQESMPLSVEPTVTVEPTPTVEPTVTVAAPSVQTVQTNGTTQTFNMKALFKISSAFFDSFTLSDLDHTSVPKTDNTYVFDEHLTNQIVAYLLQPNGDCLYISGEAGCGKTTHILQIASRLGWSVEQATLSTNVDIQDLIGHQTIINGTLTWVDGALTRAMRYGKILILNEIDTMRAGDLTLLNDVLDGKDLTIIQNNCELVKPHKNFRVICTANSFGSGDSSALYNGVRILNQAFLDRFRFLKASYPNATVEGKIVKNKYPQLDNDLVKKIIELANTVRAVMVTARNEAQTLALNAPFSTRTVLKIAGLMSLGTMHIQEAVDVALANRLSFDESSYIQRTVNDIFGHEDEAEENISEDQILPTPKSDVFDEDDSPKTKRTKKAS